MVEEMEMSSESCCYMRVQECCFGHCRHSWHSLLLLLLKAVVSSPSLSFEEGDVWVAYITLAWLR